MLFGPKSRIGRSSVDCQGGLGCVLAVTFLYRSEKARAENIVKIRPMQRPRAANDAPGVGRGGAIGPGAPHAGSLKVGHQNHGHDLTCPRAEGMAIFLRTLSNSSK